MTLLGDLVGLAGVLFGALGLAVAIPGTLYIVRQLSMQRVERSQREFALERNWLNQHRTSLTQVAVEATLALSPELAEIGGGALVTDRRWVFDEPIDFDRIEIARVTRARPRPPVGAFRLLPYYDDKRRFESYSGAMKDISPPRLFEDWSSYRLLDIATDSKSVCLTIGEASYFEMIDTCEALAHELAVAVQRQENGARVFRDLTLRNALAAPLNLTNRVVIPALNVLTMRCEGPEMTFLLHKRDADSVAVAGGAMHVTPAGVFQPGTDQPGDPDMDCDLWRSVMREYAEEYLGREDAQKHTGFELDYEEDEPFRTLSQGVATNRVKRFLLGIAIDPLTWCVEMLMVVLIEADLFDFTFDSLVERNKEGAILGAKRVGSKILGRKFSPQNVNGLLRSDTKMAPGGAGCLSLALRHAGFLQAQA